MGPNGEEGVKRNGQGGKIVAQNLSKTWTETEQKEAQTDAEEKNAMRRRTRKKKGTASPRPKARIQELKTIVEMVLDDAERGRSAEMWKSTFRKCAICDVEKLEEEKAKCLRTDDGVLLTGPASRRK